MKTRRSEQLYESARAVMPGGVNSPVRAFAAVGGRPRFVTRASGAWIEDADGNRYVDLVGSWGPAIVGHAHPDVVMAVQEAAARGLSFGACHENEQRLGALILSAFPQGQLIRFVTSGTEAAMSAIRLARAATGRSRIVKFAGCYHGHVDSLLVSAGSGSATLAQPDSAGVPPGIASLSVVVDYNDADAVAKAMEMHRGEIAGVIVEPVAGNMGLVLPQPGFLEQLRSVCDQHGALLIYDEVMTGFRVAWGGYQSTHAVQPDITCLGKVIGGGLPVAAYMARDELMNFVSPVGPMYQAGTLSGNPLGMAAGLATLRLCAAPGFYDRLDATAVSLGAGFCAISNSVGATHCGGMLGIHLDRGDWTSWREISRIDRNRYARFFHSMLDRGVWLPPSPFEAMFVSDAHGKAEIQHILTAANDSMRELDA